MTNLRAVIRGVSPPSASQEKRIKEFLQKKYNTTVTLAWEEDAAVTHGFKLEIGTSVYDWSLSGRLMQLKEAISDVKGNDNVIGLLKDAVESFSPKATAYETGTVRTVGDGIATIEGLDGAAYGEILIFNQNVTGMVLELKADAIGCIIFGDDKEIIEGSEVRRTGKTAGISVGEEILGRVVDAIGNPIDGKGSITGQAYRPIENHAPGIIDRQPVNRPLETGLLVIDSMFPIGRGQRELIIGDRQTGKTAIALDTIINQKGKDIICIYVAIGQKASSVAKLVEGLRRRNALEYTVVVCAFASDPSSLQYIAPYAGCAIGEFFMERGRDVLIVYDDLSKHAAAYRTLSLLLGRSPGREAYPGDVFYLHSRLLERAAHLSDELGGGSMTALPIVETQAGDVSAYIPTNTISITDGQIFLESDLFFAGQRPAVNIGLSVSRVGGSAQTKAMRSAAGAIRLDLAQYREIEVFTQFSGDLDDATKNQLSYGQSLMRLLIQEQYSPMKQHEQVIALVAALSNGLAGVPLNKVKDFMRAFIRYIEAKYPYIISAIENEGTLLPEMKQRLINAVAEYKSPSRDKNR